MLNRFAVAALVAFLLVPARAWAGSEADCQKGIAMLKSELKKKHPKQVRDQLQQALKNAQKEDDEGDWDECNGAIKAGTRALGK